MWRAVLGSVMALSGIVFSVLGIVVGFVWKCGELFLKCGGLC